MTRKTANRGAATPKTPSPDSTTLASVAAPATAEESHIQLGAYLGIEDAASLHAQLCEAVDDPRPVVLEGRDVRDIHTAALELFCLFCRDRREAGRVTRWQEPSASLRSVASLLGVSTLLSLAREGAAA